MSTLLKHEYLRTRGMLGVIAAAFCLFALALVIVLRMFSTALGGGLFAVLAAVLLPVVTLALGIDYWRSAYTSAGHLTHSIPVPGATIYIARLLYGAGVLVAFFLLEVVVALAVALAVHVGGQSLLQVTIDGLAQSGMPGWTPWMAVALVLGAAFTYLVTFYFAASVGSEGRLGRLGVGGPVLVWFLTYAAAQLLSLGGIALIPAGLAADPSGAITVRQVDILGAALSGEEVSALPIGVPIALLVVTAVLIWRTSRSWQHRVSLP